MVGELYHTAPPLKADMALGHCKVDPGEATMLWEVTYLMSGPGLPGCPTFCWESEGKSCLQHCGPGEPAGSVLLWQHFRVRKRMSQWCLEIGG